MKIRHFILCASILAGCTSQPAINQQDISSWKYGDTDLNEITQQLGTDDFKKVQYRAQGYNYLFIQYEIPRAKGLLSFLFKNGKLESIVKDDDYGSQGLSGCMVFPLYESDDPYKCLEDVTENLVKERLPLDFDTGSGEKRQDGVEAIGYGVELLTYSAMTGGAPIVLGAAMIPFAAIGGYQDSKIDKTMNVIELGVNIEEYEGLLAELPDEAVSTNNEFKSILMPGGLLFKEPQFFIGIHNDEVIWLDEKPAWACTSIFNIKGCTVGKNRR